MSTYAAVRDQIEDGDCILVRASNGLLTPLTKYFTRSPYTHAGVAIWIEGGLYLSELNGGGNHLIPLSQLDNVDFDVYRCPYAGHASAIRTAILDALRIRLHYSMGAFIVIGLNECFNLGLVLKAKDSLVCSGLVIAVYDALGWPTISRISSPQRLSENLKLKLQIRVPVLVIDQVMAT